MNLHKSLFQGCSQIMLQKNALSGLLFLVAILYNSETLFIGALVGLLIGTLTALLPGFDRGKLEDGLYGFNPMLVGIALLYLFEPSLTLFCILICSSVLSVVITECFYRRQLPPLTFPFVLTIWLVLAANSALQWLPFRESSGLITGSYEPYTALGLSFAQVMLQENVLTGWLFFIALLVHSRAAALYGLLGALLSQVIAIAFMFPEHLLNNGLYSFNAVLCALVFAQYRWSSAIYAALAVGCSTLLTHAMQLASFPALTFPFVLTTWLVMALSNGVSERSKRAV